MLASNPETKEVYFAGEERLLEKYVRISYPAGVHRHWESQLPIRLICTIQQKGIRFRRPVL